MYIFIASETIAHIPIKIGDTVELVFYGQKIQVPITGDLNGLDIEITPVYRTQKSCHYCGDKGEIQPCMKTTKHTIISVDYSELEEFATEIYGLVNYGFITSQQCGNDSTHEFDVDGKLDDDEQEEVEEVLKTKVVDYYQNGLLLNMLCRDGYIEPGIYLVNVRW